MTRKVNVVVADDAMEEFFRRAREHARAMDRGETPPVESTVIVEEASSLTGILKVHRKKPSLAVPKKRIAVAKEAR